MAAVSEKPTPYAIICSGDPDIGHNGCGKVYLTDAEYDRQMMAADQTWRCPVCQFGLAQFDDENFESFDTKEEN
jgi:hypothetical protein